MSDRRIGTTEWIARLVAQRQALRATGADAAVLERNRLELVRLQRRLNQELLARYRPSASAV